MKKLLSYVIVTVFLISLVTLNVSAASVTVSGGNFEVGQEVSIHIKYNGDSILEGVSTTVDYNSSVLEYKTIKGIDDATNGLKVSNGRISFVDLNFSGQSKSGSYTIIFTAIAAGNSNITVSSTDASRPDNDYSAASAAVTVVTPKPSSNANLASIKLSSGSLSPAFNANTTNYTATVKYSVDSITITGSVADGKSTYVGGGTFGLNIGDNQRVLTVTAQDGTKKSYTINIKRMTEQETADAEQAERDANPLLVIINNTDYTIVNDFTNIAIPAGFTQGTATRKESEITVLNDDAGKYQLCWLVDANGENGAFYSRDEEDNFTKLVYINANGKMYIVEDLGDYGTMPQGFILSKFSIDGTEIDAITYEDESLKEFYVLNCYVGGTTAYYRFDTVEGTLQRAADFDAALVSANTEVPTEEKNGAFAWFTNMNKTGKIVFLIIVLAAVILIAVAVILIIKIASSKNDGYEEDFVSIADNDFILNDFAEDTSDFETQVVDESKPEIEDEAVDANTDTAQQKD
ncbi:MAG: cadherin-like beta sandwich domain-containing protein [Clostridia bacterium]|nr:cadherin-like beta sandwich domain-containing protein [Clostridia bacterium]